MAECIRSDCSCEIASSNTANGIGEDDSVERSTDRASCIMHEKKAEMVDEESADDEEVGGNSGVRLSFSFLFLLR